MRERLPSGFRLGNKGLSEQLALLPGAGGGDSAGGGESGPDGGAELLGGPLPSSSVRENSGRTPACLRHAAILPCRHLLRQTFGGGLFMQGSVS